MGYLHSRPRLIASKRVRDRVQKEESPNNTKEQSVLKVSTYSALILPFLASHLVAQWVLQQSFLMDLSRLSAWVWDS